MLYLCPQFCRLNWKTGPWWFLHQEIPKFKVGYNYSVQFFRENHVLQVNFATTFYIMSELLNFFSQKE